ncbi:hypothetical protein AADZ86_19015 [Colwelliaceae bacterium BS250]
MNIQPKSLFLAMTLGLGLSFSVHALDNSQNKFTRDMQLSITTVTGNYFKEYSGLTNKPLAQLIKVPANHFMTMKETPSHINYFEVAMQVQDKVQYYMAVVEDVFSADSNNELGSDECQSSKIAKFLSF